MSCIVQTIYGIDTSDANAVVGDILSGKTAYVNGIKITGSIPSKGITTIIPGTTDQTITAKQYLSGNQTIKGDTNLVASNIKSGITIFGITGTAKTINGSIISEEQSNGNYFIIKSPSNPEQFPYKRYYLAATHVGNYALFGGGEGDHDDPAGFYTNRVDAYNTSLTRSTPTSLSRNSYLLNAAPIGNYALFAGGMGQSSNGTTPVYNTVNAYNTSLTRSTPTSLSVTRTRITSSHNGNYALFAGGYNQSGYSGYSGSSYEYYNTVDAYNTSLTRSTPTSLSVTLYESSGTTVGNYALFAGGGNYTGYSSVVNAYNTSLTRSTPTSLSVGREELTATHVGNYALIIGGSSKTAYVGTVDAYDASLTRSTPTSLSVGRRDHAASHTNHYAVIGGGCSGYVSTDIVELYDESLTHSLTDNLSVGREELTATHVGNYVLFAGGYSAGGKVVDAYMEQQGTLHTVVYK